MLMLVRTFDKSASESDQLMDTADTPGNAAAASAPRKRERPALLASTRSILAAGAIAWAHSTSSDSSISQLPGGRGGLIVLSPGSAGTVVFVGSMAVAVGTLFTMLMLYTVRNDDAAPYFW